MIKIKDTLRMYGAMLLSFGAVFVSTLFINYYLDLSALAVPQHPELHILYSAQLSMSQVTAACSGGVMGLTTLVILLFSIGHYIGDNEANMGILKALGYSELRICVQFLKFGCPVFVGTALGYAAGMAYSAPFYGSMTSYEGVNPALSFHPMLPLLMVALPSVLFAVLAFAFAYLKLQKPALDMIKGTKRIKISKRTLRFQQKNGDLPFLVGLRRVMRGGNPVLSLFVWIATWGFSAMLQMAFTMMAMEMTAVAPMISAPIGIMMGFVTLLIAADTLLSVNRPYLSLMKAYGYTDGECSRALLDGYRPIAWAGFVCGTLYQFYLMKFMVALFAGAYDAKVVFSTRGLMITLILFTVYYEGVMLFYKRKITHLPLKEAMSE